MQKRPAFIIAGWLVAAATAVAIGVVAVSLLGDSITGARPEALSRVDVAQALEATPAPAPATPATTTAPTTTIPPTTTPAGDPPATTTPAKGTTGQPRGFGTAGGQVVASCRDGGAYLESWSPAQGFEAEDVDRGPDDEASLTFKSGDSSGRGGDEIEIEIDVRCEDGAPVAVIENDD